MTVSKRGCWSEFFVSGEWRVAAIVLGCTLLWFGCQGSDPVTEEGDCPPICAPDTPASDALVPFTPFDDSGFFIEILDVLYLPERSQVYMCTNAKGILSADISQPGTLRYGWIDGEYGLSPEHDLSSLEADICQHMVLVEGLDEDVDLVAVTNHGYEYAPNGFIALVELTPIPEESVAKGILPLRAYHYAPGYRYEGLAVEDGYLYAAARDHGFEVFAMTADSLESIGQVVNFYDAMDVILRYPYAFVADGGGGLAAIDIGDPFAPEMVSYLPLDGVIRDGELIDENTLVLAAGGKGVYVIDVTDPVHMKTRAHVDTHGTAMRVAADNSYVHVANWEDIVSLDVTDPDAPILVAEDTGPTIKAWPRYLAVAAHDDIVIAGEWNGIIGYEFHPGAVGPEIRADIWELNFGEVTAKEATRALVLYNDGQLPLTVSVDSMPEQVMAVVPEELTIQPGEVDFVEITMGVTDAEIQVEAFFRTNDVDEELFGVYFLANHESPGVGEPFPDATFIDSADGAPIASSALFQGNVTLLTYYASF